MNQQRKELVDPRNAAASAPASLTIVIPAYDEEEAIGATIKRTLDGRSEVMERGGLDAVQIIVVDDGSTDATLQIANSYDEIEVVSFGANRGYGAAIKEGFRNGDGDLVGFLDADGTCDPRFFGDLCAALSHADADIALGSRLTPESRMPRVRRLGNRIFATMLGILANRRVTDAASGMRVMRREALNTLGRLPDGLHYTPAMSARAVLSGLRVVEIPMSYEERRGESKLSVWKDGVRFTRAIIDGVLFFRPARLFLIAALVALAIAAILSLSPMEYYAQNRSVQEWMIYRFIVAFLFGSIGFLSLSAAAIATRMTDLRLASPDRTFWEAGIARLFEGPFLTAVAVILGVGAVVLLWPGFVEYWSTGQLTMHWSRVIVAAFALLLAFQGLITRVLLRVIHIWLEVSETSKSD
jgi:glycosyltransferase involved in cell wall biosynthesis